MTSWISTKSIHAGAPILLDYDSIEESKLSFSLPQSTKFYLTLLPLFMSNTEWLKKVPEWVR